jgi:hypothetical protein
MRRIEVLLAPAIELEDVMAPISLPLSLIPPRTTRARTESRWDAQKGLRR